jgi:hypothetical protein
MFPRRALGGLRLCKSMSIEGAVFLYRGVEAKHPLPISANHDADKLIGDFDRVTFRHSLVLPATGIPICDVSARKKDRPAIRF